MAVKGRLWEHRVLAAGLLLLALLVLGAGYRMLRDGVGRVCEDFLAPYMRLARIGSSGLSDQSLLAYSREELAEKLEALQERNNMLALQAASAGKLLEENAALRKLAGFSPPRTWTSLNAEVIMRDPMMWREHFTVDRGEADGVIPGAAVIDIDASGRPLLLGVVERVGRRTSTVRTLQNGALRLSAQLVTSRAVGFLNAGTNVRRDGVLPLGFLPRDVRYVHGEAVLTTGFELGIPPGVVIGKLVAVEEAGSVFSGRPYISGWLEPAAGFDNVRFVMIAVPAKRS